MGLDARRGAGFPPELYEDNLQGGKTKTNEADEPILQAAGESLREMAARTGALPVATSLGRLQATLRQENDTKSDAA
ncbi:hypothetical protein MAMT_00870 [Methylacidimicrobium tartarophylax]|uniref:Uncharacterized protein n=2 Tax=Methylacidimicrobium tartarophylax TaxID=1041768 RepID=A0A5E6M8M6_9BACT|nr:hypothetical protein MAMT_00870 [Methylacidimicrobium tartarophylax]